MSGKDRKHNELSVYSSSSAAHLAWLDSFAIFCSIFLPKNKKLIFYPLAFPGGKGGDLSIRHVEF